MGRGQDEEIGRDKRMGRWGDKGKVGRIKESLVCGE
jgi:hypothetical protein